jgi:START domain
MRNPESFAYLILILVMFLCSIVANGSAKEQWELVKDEDGIKVFLKPDPGSKIKEFKGVTNINSSLDSILAVLYDADACPKWLHNCREATRLADIGFYEAYIYQVVDFPFPAKDRDLVLHTVMTQDPETKDVTIKLNSTPDYIPDTKNFRIKKSTGYYFLKPKPDGTVEVTWQHFTDPGGRVPTWIVNSLLVDTPFQTLKNLKKIVHEQKYQKAKLKYSSEGMADGWEVID